MNFIIIQSESIDTKAFVPVNVTLKKHPVVNRQIYVNYCHWFNEGTYFL